MNRRDEPSRENTATRRVIANPLHNRHLPMGRRVFNFSLVAMAIALFLLPVSYGLYVVGGTALNGYLAANGHTGSPGEITVRYEKTAQRQCYGDFRPDEGETLTEIAVEVPGSCAEGRHFQGHLVAGPGEGSSFDAPRAWGSGSQDWWGLLPLVLLLALGTGLMVFIGIAAVRSQLRRMRKTTTASNP